ncbi:voltage-dependent T-type calcium channel subunit alpha-1I-like isoform X1, partial [Lates japonicus]
QIRMAEIEQASLQSEQLSDKSSSPALPDDLSLDEHTAYQLLAREGKVGSSHPGSSHPNLPTLQGPKVDKGLRLTSRPPGSHSAPRAHSKMLCLGQDCSFPPGQTFETRPGPRRLLTLQATREPGGNQSSGGSTNRATSGDSIDPSGEDSERWQHRKPWTRDVAVVRGKEAARFWAWTCLDPQGLWPTLDR